MDIGMVLTAIGSVGAIVGANITLISWVRGDVKSFESEIRGWKDEINKEMKDFHGRLCAIEARSKERTDP